MNIIMIQYSDKTKNYLNNRLLYLKIYFICLFCNSIVESFYIYKYQNDITDIIKVFIILHNIMNGVQIVFITFAIIYAHNYNTSSKFTFGLYLIVIFYKLILTYTYLVFWEVSKISTILLFNVSILFSFHTMIEKISDLEYNFELRYISIFLHIFNIIYLTIIALIVAILFGSTKNYLLFIWFILYSLYIILTCTKHKQSLIHKFLYALLVIITLFLFKSINSDDDFILKCFYIVFNFIMTSTVICDIFIIILSMEYIELVEFSARWHN
jgi:hypothetical protein